MKNCKICGVSIDYKYTYCYDCYQRIQDSPIYIDSSGYARFKDGDIPVHIRVAEKKLGRPLRQGEVVHHKDRNKLNNDPSNLWVFHNQDEHDLAHVIDAERHGEYASYRGFNKKYEY